MPTKRSMERSAVMPGERSLRSPNCMRPGIAVQRCSALRYISIFHMCAHINISPIRPILLAANDVAMLIGAARPLANGAVYLPKCTKPLAKFPICDCLFECIFRNLIMLLADLNGHLMAGPTEHRLQHLEPADCKSWPSPQHLIAIFLFRRMIICLCTLIFNKVENSNHLEKQPSVVVVVGFRLSRSARETARQSKRENLNKFDYLPERELSCLADVWRRRWWHDSHYCTSLNDYLLGSDYARRTLCSSIAERIRVRHRCWGHTKLMHRIAQSA